MGKNINFTGQPILNQLIIFLFVTFKIKLFVHKEYKFVKLLAQASEMNVNWIVRTKSKDYIINDINNYEKNKKRFS